MTGVRKSLNITLPKRVSKALSADSCHIGLETSPAQCAEESARYDGPAEPESDSGDSLFITQKPVPGAVRAGKRRRTSFTSSPESEDDASSSASHGEPTAAGKGQRKKFRLPKYSFPFLSEKKCGRRSRLLPVQQNTGLHNAAMRGFFKCVREMWQEFETGHVELSLPTLDMDVAPLSEKEEEENSEDGDIKVVEKKHFLAPSKAKCSKPWYTPAKRDDQVKQERKRMRRRTQKSQKKMSYKMSTKAVTLLSSDVDSSDTGHPQRDTRDKPISSDILEQTETPKKRRTKDNQKILLQEKESGVDSDATVCDLLQLQGSQREHTQAHKEATVTVTVERAYVFQTDDLSQAGREEDVPDSQSLLQSLPEFVSHVNNESVRSEASEMKKKKKKKKKVKGNHPSLGEDKSQSQEEPEGLHDAESVNMEADETLSPPEDSRAEPPVPQGTDNSLRQEKKDFPDSTPTAKKKKRSKSSAGNVAREVVENSAHGERLEDSGFSVMSNMENVTEMKKKKKKKKLKRNVEDDEGVDEAEEPPNDDSVMQKKKKKEKRTLVREEHGEEDVENTEVCQETLGPSYKKKRRKHKTKKQSSSLEDGQVGEEDGVSWSNEGVALDEFTGLSVKKRKRKKKRKGESISEGVDIHSNPDKSITVENTGHEDRDTEQVTKKKKKKKKKKTRELSSREVSQSDVSCSVQERDKKKTSSFPVADSEEKEAQSYPQQQSSSTCVAAHVCGAGKAVGDVEPESAQSAVTSGDGVSKKKKKRKRNVSAPRENVEDDHKPGFQEPDKTRVSLTDTVAKKKNRGEVKVNM